MKLITNLLAFLLCLFAFTQATPIQNKVAQAKATFKSYIVVFEDTVPKNIIEETKVRILQSKGSITHTFNIIFNGFTMFASDDTVKGIRTLDEGIVVQEDSTGPMLLD